jgi:catalase
MANPTSRANYEPNSWGPAIGGPREDPVRGFTTYPSQESGPKRRLRPESFADHYSQARQFYLSQTPVERRHLVDAFVFELSKCERADIRTRVVAGLRNVEDNLARAVADGLGLGSMPDPMPAARETIGDLAPSPALSILANGPSTFAGRKIGVLVTDGADAALIAALRERAGQEHVNVEFVAPSIGGIEADDGTRLSADQKVDGGPSVLYDAVVVLTTKDGASLLAQQPAARDFVTDAYAHCKFIGYTDDATPLFNATGIGNLADDGFVQLGGDTGAADFLARCRDIRYWARQAVPG